MMDALLTIGAPREQRAFEALPYHEWRDEDSRPKALFYGDASGAYWVRFPGAADFEITEATGAVHCWPAPGADDEALQHLYRSQVLPLLRSQRQQLTLHGSAVALGQTCIAFVGASGRGKSTLAASFALAGYPFLTDDELRLTTESATCMVIPSRPSLRLRPDSQAALHPQGMRAGATRKQLIDAGTSLRHCNRAKPLRGIYLLGDKPADVPRIAPLEPAAALIELVRHSFLLDVRASDLLSSHFGALARVVEQVPVWRLEFPKAFERLKAVRFAVQRHQQRSSAIEQP